MQKQKTHNQYQTWVKSLQRARTSGWRGIWIIWSAILLLLIISFVSFSLKSHNLRDFIVPFLPQPPTSVITIIARHDIRSFTELAPDNISIKQDDQEEQHISLPATVRIQEEAFYQRVTLRHYNEGEEIRLSELGPKLSANHTYQIREVTVNSSTVWIHSDDTLTLILVNTACPSMSVATKTPSFCLSQQVGNALSSQLKDVVIIQVGKTGQSGLIAVLIAIPLDENKEAVAFLDTEESSIVAYPLLTIPGKSTTEKH